MKNKVVQAFTNPDIVDFVQEILRDIEEYPQEFFKLGYEDYYKKITKALWDEYKVIKFCTNPDDGYSSIQRIMDKKVFSLGDSVMVVDCEYEIGKIFGDTRGLHLRLDYNRPNDMSVGTISWRYLSDL